jgi:hypothetical protein
LFCGLVGIYSGLFVPMGSERPWPKLGLVIVGCLSLVIWHMVIRWQRTPRIGKDMPGPTFDDNEPGVSDASPTTTHLIEEIRRSRGRKKPLDN